MLSFGNRARRERHFSPADRNSNDSRVMASATVEQSKIALARNPAHGIALERLFARIGELTTLPSQASRLLEITETEGATVEEVAEIVMSDAPTTMRVLRRVNSAYYGLPNKVDEIPLAVNLLGVKELRDIALTACMSRLLCGVDAHSRSGGFNREDLWIYSVAIAKAAARIAERSKRVNPNTAYAAGLLHDIGYFLLDQHLRRHFLRYVSNARQAVELERSSVGLEEEAFTFNHASLGAYVAGQWSLSDAICAAIEYHHRVHEYEGEHAELVATVALADHFAAMQGWTGLGLPGPPVEAEALLNAAQTLALDPADIATEVAEAIEEASSAAASR